MKILFSVVGIGLGHATRSLAVIKELQKLKAKVKVTSYGDAQKFFKENKIKSIDTGGYSYRGEEYTFNLMLNLMKTFKERKRLKKDFQTFKKTAKEFKPDIIFNDTDPNAFYYAYDHEIKNYMLSNVQSAVHNYPLIPRYLKNRNIKFQRFALKRAMNFITNRTNGIFSPSFEPRIKYKEKIRYTDVIVRKKPSELPSIKKLRNKLRIDDEFYLVSVGGSDIERHLYQILKKVLPAFDDKKFVVSTNYATKKVVKKGNMTILPFIPNMLEHLKICKGVIAPAGHSTISENICYNKPMFLIPVINHIEQLANAALIDSEGLGSAAFIEKKKTTSILLKSLIEFFEKEDKIEKKLKKYKFKGEGAKQIAKAIIRK